MDYLYSGGLNILGCYLYSGGLSLLCWAVFIPLAIHFWCVIFILLGYLYSGGPYVLVDYLYSGGLPIICQCPHFAQHTSKCLFY